MAYTQIEAYFDKIGCDVKIELPESNEEELEAEVFDVEIEELPESHSSPASLSSSDDLPESNVGTEVTPRVKRKYKRTTHFYPCDECDHRYKSKRKLEIHKRTHWDVEPYSCTQCEFTCRDLQEITEHTAEHVTKAEKRYTCTFCSFDCATYALFLTHTRSHSSGHQSYACDECDYSCSNKEALKRHRMVHTGLKPHSCPICDYCCLAKSCMREHIAKHTGEKRLRCSFCEYGTPSRSTLMRHVRRHTGERPNQCPQCDYRSVQRITLLRHIKRKHTSELFTLNQDASVE